MILAASLLSLAAAGLSGSPRPNILMVVVDDFGVDMLAGYGEGSDPPLTPTMDGLVANGVLFRNASSNPNCSPTRATILTGRYGLRTGIGDVVTSKTAALPLSEVLLPELLDLAGTGYDTGAFGKWHLGNEFVGGKLAPNLAGFDHYDGYLFGSFDPPPPGISYYHWPRVVDGEQLVSMEYATTVNVDAAMAWIAERTNPWFCYLAFNAPHSPYHTPPAGLYSEDLTGLDPAITPRPFYKAAVEALDTELGRLLAALPAPESTVVILLGDNGTPPVATIAPFQKNHAKATVYEGGVNVPLVISGPLATTTPVECDALVNTTDLFATVAELAGVSDPTAYVPGPLDSISLVPYLVDPFLPSLRTYTYVERFRPVGATGAVPLAHRGIRDGRYKVVSLIEGYELYDLFADPFEQVDLIESGVLTPTEEEHYTTLVATLEDLIHHPGPTLVKPRPVAVQPWPGEPGQGER